MSEEFLTRDYIAQAEELFWRATHTSRPTLKLAYLKAAAEILEKAIRLDRSQISPTRHGGDLFEQSVAALAQKIRDLRSSVQELRARDEARDSSRPDGA